MHTYLRSAIEIATLLSYHFLNSMWDKPLYTKIDVELKLILYILLSILFRFIFSKSYPNFVPGSRFSHFQGFFSNEQGHCLQRAMLVGTVLSSYNYRALYVYALRTAVKTFAS